MTMTRKLVPAQIKALGDDEVEVRMSTATVARDGHILLPQGARLENYKKNPVFLWNHDVDGFPVGRSEEITIDGEEVVSRVRFPPTGLSRRADECRGLVKSGFINGVSVGFDPIDGEPIDPKKPRGGMRVSDWELIECSFCCVPVDTEALVIARAESAPTNRSEENPGMSEKDGLKAKHTRALERASKVTIVTRGLYEVANLAYMLEQFGYAHACSEWEAEVEGDESPVPAMLGEALVKFGQAFIAMSKEEVTELLAGKDLALDESAIVVEERAYVEAAKTPGARAWRTGIALARAGRRLSASNEKKLSDAQENHARAMKHHKAHGEHQEAVGAHMDAIAGKQEKAQKAHGELGDALQSAKGEPDKAAEHVARAVKAHKALGGALGDMSDTGAAMKDSHADAGDAHAATGRYVKSAQRCVRSVVDGSTASADDEDGDSTDVQTSSGTDESESSDKDRSYRRRQVDLLALGADLA